MKVSIFCHLLSQGKILEIDAALDLPEGGSLLDAVDELARTGRLPAPAAAEFRGGPGSFSLLVNGCRQVWNEVKDRPLAGGEEISIVNPFAGG